MKIEIETLTGEIAWSQRHQVRDIYEQGFGCTRAEADTFISGSFSHIRDYPGGNLLLARIEGKPVGMLYGYTYAPHQWWAQRVGASIIQAGYRHNLNDAFSLVEFAVLPGYQGRGIGSALLQFQLTHQPEAYTLLSTDADPGNRAFSLYKRHGFEVIVSLFRYSEYSDPAHIMGVHRHADSTKC